ncbi:MAG: hypothetical protein ABW043_17005 [Devosia sp.]|uniref:hypothetical protein n=1 Tax=Devosia sp. TaxID=1871048 RepID=UPI0033956E98
MKRQFGAHRQTKSQNEVAFRMWLVGCTDEALARAEPESIARSYGLRAPYVAQEITAQKVVRTA